MADLVKVRRSNVILEIPNDEFKINQYFNNGWDILDEHENIIKKAIPNDYDELRKLYLEKCKECDDLKAILNAGKAEVKVAEDAQEETTEQVEAEPTKKKNTRSKKS